MIADNGLIVFDNVSKFYGETLGVNRVSLAIEPGITSLVGPNGAGKTTLMNLMTGLLVPTRGAIHVFGAPTTDVERCQRSIGYCPQFDTFPKGLSGFQLIVSMMEIHGHPKMRARELASNAIERVGMAAAANRRVAGYSKGMRQRIKLALAIAHEPRALVLDEPLNGLDPRARAEAIALFRSFAESGMHVVISSHIMHEVDMIADRIVMVSGGYVVAEGDIQSVRGEMEEEHPIRILVRCDKPAVIAAAIFGEPGVVEVQMHNDGQGLLIATRKADQFYSMLNRIVLDHGIAIEAVAPADENANAVYQYLVGSGTGNRHMMNVWLKQIDAVARFELRRYIAARRWLGVYLLALVPMLLFLPGAILGSRWAPGQIEMVYATVFQAYVLRFAIFVSCGVVFSQLFRGETLEKTLHFYLLTPIRRENLAIGKYLAACVATAVLFATSVTVMHLLLYSLGGGHLLSLARYLVVASLGCVAYGAVFILLGLTVKNAAFPGLMLLGWESVSFALPGSLQRVSIVYYLQPLLPVQIDRGPFAIVTEGPSVWLAVPVLLMFSAALVAVSAWRVRRLEVTYSAD